MRIHSSIVDVCGDLSIVDRRRCFVCRIGLLWRLRLRCCGEVTINRRRICGVLDVGEWMCDLGFSDVRRFVLRCRGWNGRWRSRSRFRMFVDWLLLWYDDLRSHHWLSLLQFVFWNIHICISLFLFSRMRAQVAQLVELPFEAGDSLIR